MENKRIKLEVSKACNGNFIAWMISKAKLIVYSIKSDHDYKEKIKIYE